MSKPHGATTKNTAQSSRRDVKAQVDRMAEEQFFATHDRSNVLHVKAFDLHMQMHRRLMRKPGGKMIEHLRHPDVLQAIAAHRALDMQHNLKVLECKASEVGLDESRLHILSLVATSEGLFPENGQAIDIHRLCIMKKPRTRPAMQQLKQVLDLAKVVASGSEGATTPEAICAGQIPNKMKCDEKLQEFLVDLCEFMVNEGEKGRQLICRIIDDEQFARELLVDCAENLPEQIIHLCQMANKVRSVAVDKLKDEKRTLGFGSG